MTAPAALASESPITFAIPTNATPSVPGLVIFLILGLSATPKGAVSTDDALRILRDAFNITALKCSRSPCSSSSRSRRHRDREPRLLVHRPQ
jgi:hypothetical protein